MSTYDNTTGGFLDPRDEYLTVADVVQWLGVKRNTVYAWKSRGQIPWTKIGSTILIPRRALLSYLQRSTVHPGHLSVKRRASKLTRRVDEILKEENSNSSS